MAYKAITTPYDAQTLAEWQARFGIWLGETWANLDSTLQTELGRYINEAHNYIERSYGDAEWSIHRASIAVTGDNAGTDDDGNYLYKMPVAFRRLVVIREAGSTEKKRARTSKLINYVNAWNDGTATHPWAADSRQSTWFFHSWSDDSPPRQQWVRIGGESSGVTAIVFFRPFWGLLATGVEDEYPGIPADVQAELDAHMKARTAAFKGDMDKYQLFSAIRNEEHAQTENATDFGEDPVAQGRDSEFDNLLG